LLPVVRRLKDSVEQDHYVLKIADIIGVSKEALLAKLHQTEAAEQKPLKKPAAVPVPIDRQVLEHSKVQDHFLALMLLQPRLREYMDLVTAEMFSGDDAQTLLEFLQANPDFDGKVETAAALKPIGDYVKITLLQYEELYSGLEFTELHYEAARLQARLVEQFVKHKKEQVITQLHDANEASTTSLLEEVRTLDSLLKRVKGADYASKRQEER
jgi:ParB-like chromosome segregation protein Spo0J